MQKVKILGYSSNIKRSFFPEQDNKRDPKASPIYAHSPFLNKELLPMDQSSVPFSIMKKQTLMNLLSGQESKGKSLLEANARPSSLSIIPR